MQASDEEFLQEVGPSTDQLVRNLLGTPGAPLALDVVNVEHYHAALVRFSELFDETPIPDERREEMEIQTTCFIGEYLRRRFAGAWVIDDVVGSPSRGEWMVDIALGGTGRWRVAVARVVDSLLESPLPRRIAGRVQAWIDQHRTPGITDHLVSNRASPT